MEDSHGIGHCLHISFRHWKFSGWVVEVSRAKNAKKRHFADGAYILWDHSRTKTGIATVEHNMKNPSPPLPERFMQDTSVSDLSTWLVKSAMTTYGRRAPAT
jgi:hypothetical protein